MSYDAYLYRCILQSLQIFNVCMFNFHMLQSLNIFDLLMFAISACFDTVCTLFNVCVVRSPHCSNSACYDFTMFSIFASFDLCLFSISTYFRSLHVLHVGLCMLQIVQIPAHFQYLHGFIFAQICAAFRIKPQGHKYSGLNQYKWVYTART